MMHVFQFKGVAGVIKFLLMVALLLTVTLGFPSLYLMVLWNALVFEAFGGPEIGILEGFILWAIVLVLLQLMFQPKIELQFKRLSDSDSNKPSSHKP